MPYRRCIIAARAGVYGGTLRYSRRLLETRSYGGQGATECPERSRMESSAVSAARPTLLYFVQSCSSLFTAGSLFLSKAHSILLVLLERTALSMHSIRGAYIDACTKMPSGRDFDATVEIVEPVDEY